MHQKLPLWVSLFFFLFALGYCISFISAPVVVMIGDTRGYDPGGRVVPIAASAVLALLSLIVFVRESQASKTAPTQAETVRLVITNIALSVVYILVFRSAGYIISTSVFLYVLIVLNLHATEGKNPLHTEIIRFAGMMIYILASYTGLRLAVRGMYRLARSYGMTWAREPVIQSLAAVVAVFVVWLAARWVMRRFCLSRSTCLAIQASGMVTLCIYIVFRMLFLVQLPTGITVW